MINIASALLICLPIITMYHGDALSKSKVGVYRVGNEVFLLSLVSSGFIGLTGAAYLQSLKGRKPS